MADHSSSAGFAVHDDALAGYAREVGRIGTELHNLAHRDLRTVRSLPGDAFGPLAHETGFTTALTRLGDRIGAVTQALAADVHTIESRMDSTRRNYRSTEKSVAARLTGVLA